VAHNGVVAGGGRLTDWISLGVLASSVPRDAVDEAVAAAGKGAKRADGKLPPHVMVYFAMALALFSGEDYEEVAARLTETLASWGCWDDAWSTPTSGGLTQARKRLGPEPLELLFEKVAVPVAGVLTRGAFLREWRLMAVEEDWLLIADRGFYNWPGWQAAAAAGAALLWRVQAGLRLPVLDLLPDGSYLSLVARPTLHDKTRNKLIAAARAGERLDPAQAMRVRVIEYEIPDRDGDGELIALITTITDPAAASAQELAEAYCQRWEEETGNDQLKTHLRGPGKVLRSKSPDMVRQEIYGYLLTHYAISALICQAATEADIDPDRVKFLRTVRILRRRAADPAFPP